MATAILKQIFDVAVTRTRDAYILDTLDLVYDVGNGKFDHHQVDKERRKNGTPYAACGLIWREFGRAVVQAFSGTLSQEQIETVYKQVDATLIEGIDAQDNGIRTCVTIIPSLNLSTIVLGFNPTWEEEDAAEEDIRFNQAVDFASIALQNTLKQHISTANAKAYIIEAYNNRKRPELLILDKLYPWARSLNGIDAEKKILFVIYPRDNDYLLQTVRGSGGTNRNRKSLPKAWAGKRNEELGALIGIDDAVFCHPDRFIAGAGSLDSILKMADIAIAEPEERVSQGFVNNIKKLLLKKYVSR